MADLKFCHQQLGRLIALEQFPTKRAALTELATALSFADNEVIVSMVLSDWLMEEETMPTPAALRMRVSSKNIESRERGAAEKRDKVCQTCEGIGWLYVQPREALPILFPGITYTGVKPCQCRARYYA